MAGDRTDGGHRDRGWTRGLVQKLGRLMGRSVVDLAGDVDDALGALAMAQGQREAAAEALRLSDIDVAEAQARVNAARDALFTEHPHLAPPGGLPMLEDKNPRTRVPLPDEALANPGAWDPDPVEVDDPDDPEYTAGAPVSIPVDDSEPLPPIVWQEHDDG